MVRNQEFIRQYRVLHQTGAYGWSSEKLIARILPEVLELRPHSILDYGCGQSRLVDMLQYDDDVQVFRYDPAIPGIDTLPVQQADLVINTDVMEHVPEEDVDDVLDEISRISDRAIFNIATAPARCILPNGQNAHCTVRPADWWQARLQRHFDCVEGLPTSRPTKCMFKTWESVPSKWLLKKWWGARENVRRRTRQLIGSERQHTDRRAV
ncbi:MAG: hypothetical protein ACF8PG_10405 [Maioricimonas sp. JB045]|mgnify:CR=1 FL=1|uniref:class I SAM-dependent methyltransferase n=1 Tax=Maioricimonas sp. JC845 TaxID=3232138 RepID=UPI00345A4BF9